MILGLFLSSILIGANEPAMAAGACAVVNKMKGTMLPAGSSDPVVHGALLYFADAFAGAVYGTRGGDVFYEEGGKFSEPISSAARSRAMTMFGISNSSGTIVAAPKPNFSAVLAPDVMMKGCF